MKRDGQFPCVAILVESSRSHGRGLLHGIAEYLHPCSPWSTFLDDRSPRDELPASLRTLERRRRDHMHVGKYRHA